MKSNHLLSLILMTALATAPAIYAAGTVGPAGPTGPKGATGATGPAGPKGDTGAKGAAGATGQAGVAGPKGDPGIQGPAGTQGSVGNTGATGATGPAGNAGIVQKFAISDSEPDYILNGTNLYTVDDNGNSVYTDLSTLSPVPTPVAIIPDGFGNAYIIANLPSGKAYEVLAVYAEQNDDGSLAQPLITQEYLDTDNHVEGAGKATGAAISAYSSYLYLTVTGTGGALTARVIDLSLGVVMTDDTGPSTNLKKK